MMLRSKSSSMKPAVAGSWTFLLQAAIASTTKRPSAFSTLASYTTATIPTRDPFAIMNAISVAASPSTTAPPSMRRQLHPSTIKLGVCADTFTMDHLLIFYSRRGNLSCALDLFDEMLQRNLVTWTAMVSGMVRSGAPELGLRLFVSMVRGGFCPNEFALASVLSACCQSVEANAKLGLGLSLHGLAFKAALDGNPYVGSSLMLMYAKYGYVAAAEQLVQMHHSGITPDVFTYISAVKASSITRELKFGQQLHGLVIQNMLQSDTSVMNVLVDMYFRVGLKDIAVAIFGKIRRKDTISWNTMISGLARDEDEKVAADCFVDMSRYGCKPNQVTFSVMLRLCGAKENASLGLQIFGLAYLHGYSDNVLVANAVINMLSRCGLLSCAYAFFCNLSVRNVATCNEMIAGYGLHSCSEDAMRLFRSLVCFGAKPDEFTYPAVLCAFQQAHDARNHEQIHASVLKHGFASCKFVSASLVKAKAALGSIQGSLKVTKDAEKVDLVSWGITMSAFLKHGLNDEVLFLFNLFRSDFTEKPDEFILATVLNACANSTLIR
ncbi:Pentatricopeptide repeat-containing protein [Dichanthelium oligosanthes]|uniref:Pentatricopeptide repeat-containing protein n=1 Tax=Dichanthelium oligosanthes TaxID=888268 RepID=A0A1E5URQ2_9POAL|nr:Pentatricopeptide repeat-containing protein [Dichanthelium oligosanthes]